MDQNNIIQLPVYSHLNCNIASFLPLITNFGQETLSFDLKTRRIRGRKRYLDNIKKLIRRFNIFDNTLGYLMIDLKINSVLLNFCYLEADI